MKKILIALCKHKTTAGEDQTALVDMELVDWPSTLAEQHEYIAEWSNTQQVANASFFKMMGMLDPQITALPMMVPSSVKAREMMRNVISDMVTDTISDHDFNRMFDAADRE